MNPFWVKVKRGQADECWPWLAYTKPDGYGQVSIFGEVHYAHRVAWALTHGPIPRGRSVLHECDNPPCCNPAHLFLGTQGTNIADMNQKRRNGRTKLGADDIIVIRASDATPNALATEYGVSASQIRRVRSGKCWSA